MMPTSELSDIHEIEWLRFRNPNHLANALQSGTIPLPVRVVVGESGFTVTKENLDAFALGVLCATDEAWEFRFCPDCGGKHDGHGPEIHDNGN